MVQSVRVLGFLPTMNGLHFSNSNWPIRPAYAVYAFGQKILDLGDAHNGYCGGMTFTVKDLFEARLLPPTDTAPPAVGTPLLDYIVARSLDSFTEENVTHFLGCIQLPDHDTVVWGHGLAWQEITQEWPQIKADLDSNHVSPLGLVRGQEPPFYGNFTGIQDLGKCHQVLAWGYDLDGSNLTIYIYDPNYPDDGNTAISLNIANPSHTTQIAVSHYDIEPFGPFRGFFRMHYAYHDPTTPTRRQIYFPVGPIVSIPAISSPGPIGTQFLPASISLLLLSD